MATANVVACGRCIASVNYTFQILCLTFAATLRWWIRPRCAIMLYGFFAGKILRASLMTIARRTIEPCLVSVSSGASGTNRQCTETKSPAARKDSGFCLHIMQWITDGYRNRTNQSIQKQKASCGSEEIGHRVCVRCLCLRIFCI